MNEDITRAFNFNILKPSNRFRLLLIGIFFLFIAALSLIVFISYEVDADQIYGNVSDNETGDPIEGADVYIYDPDDKKTRRGEGKTNTQTDNDGYYEIDCDSGDYRIYIKKDGYEAHDEAVKIEGRVEHNANLTPENGDNNDDSKKEGDDDAQIYGTVTDNETGDPIEGADVYVYKPEDKDNEKTRGKAETSTQTDNDGYYEIDCDSGDYRIYINKDGYKAHDEAVRIEGRVEYNANLTPGNNEKDDSKKNGDYPTKDGKDSTKDGVGGDESNNGIFNKENGVLISGSLAIVVLSIGALLLMHNKSGYNNSGTRSINDNDWTTCQKCGTELKMKNLSSHHKSVHPMFSKKNKDKIKTNINGKGKNGLKKGGG